MHQNIKPAEKVLLLAQQLPASKWELVQEAVKTERLLNEITETSTDYGNELNQYLHEVLESHLEGIEGLIEFSRSQNQALLEHSLQLLIQSSQGLEELEELVNEAKEELPLTA